MISDDRSPASFEDNHHREVDGISIRKGPWPLSKIEVKINCRRMLKQFSLNHCIKPELIVVDFVISMMSQLSEHNADPGLLSDGLHVSGWTYLKFTDLLPPALSHLPPPIPCRSTVISVWCFDTAFTGETDFLLCGCNKCTRVLLTGQRMMKALSSCGGMIDVDTNQLFVEFKSIDDLKNPERLIVIR